LTSPAARAGGVLSINLRALQQNYLVVQRQVSPAECAASVKADAYGLGMDQVAPALKAAGCRTFFVALPEEGKRLRAILPDAKIYILDGLLAGEAEFYAAHDLRPVLSQPEEVEEWAQWCEGEGRRRPAGLHVETGINRLGLEADQVRAIAGKKALFSSFEPSLIMSHLAKADEPDDPFNELQLQRFEALRALLPPMPASLANSAGAFMPREFHLDLVRPGIGIYGGNPFLSRANPFRPVVRLEGKILQVKRVAAGDSVGYGGSWRAKRVSLIAVVAAGYADGYFRACSFPGSADQAKVVVCGSYAPVVGRVSMDMITIDVTDVPGQAIVRGTMVELFGEAITVDDLARWSGSIAYEILTRLGSRYPRLYSAFDSSPKVPS
jgi:alanine racemase